MLRGVREIIPFAETVAAAGAILPSESLLYKLHITIFGIVPCAIVYGFFQALRAEDFHFSFMMVLVLFAFLFLGLILVVGVYMFRNFVPSKITTDQTGQYYSSLLRRVHVRWDQAESVRVAAWLIGRGFFELKTQNENLNIPMLMKERDNPYPKLSMVSNKWIGADGTQMLVGADNCPLYQEIQEHMKGRIEQPARPDHC